MRRIPNPPERSLRNSVNIKVAKLMRKDVVTTTEDTALCEAARIMLTQKARRLPVLDKTGKVVGIIARNDILKMLDKEAICE